MKRVALIIFMISIGLSTIVRAGVSLNSSIIMFGENDFNNCGRQVEKAMSFGNKKLQLIPTVYGKISNNQVMEYFYRDANYQYQKVTPEQVTRFTAQMDKCIKFAASKKIQLTITPHLDDKEGKVWRNGFKFDPLKKYRGHSYYSIMIEPFSKIILSKETFFNLSGEMGSSISLFPRSYIKILKKMKELPFKKGISFNYNNQFGSPRGYSSSIAKLFRKLDFIGFSNYFSVRENCTDKDFKNHMLRFLAPLSRYTNDLPKQIHITEIGIGGNSSHSNNNYPALTAYAAAQTPHSGIWGKYIFENDPWQILELKKMRVRYYNKLLKYLASIRRSRSFHITHAFLWSLNSWDVQGLYPSSKNYRDAGITESIMRHNQQN